MVGDFFSQLFSTRGFMPHGHCYQWQPLPFWISAGSDFVIAVSYFAIAALIYFLVSQRKELRFRGIFLLFSSFILLCGITHLMALIGMWHPFYRLDALFKLATGVVSAATALILIINLKELRTIPTPDQYQKTLADLEMKRREKRRAEEANQAKSVFLSSISHELRTPLSSIICGLDIIASLDQSETTKEITEIARDSSKHLLHLINDVLDLSKIEAGELILHNEPFSATSVVGSVCDMLNLQAGGKGLEFRSSFDEPAPVILLGDPNRLTQVMTNVIGNAVKFTLKGYVEVRLRLEVLDEYRLSLIVEIEDSGPGIPKEEMESIFTPFMQGDLNGDENAKGTGLGLSISKRLVELMGGSITVRSELGTGSCFTVSIPFKRASEAIQNQFLDASDREADLVLKDRAETSLNILLVEDNSASEGIIRKILELRGHRVSSSKTQAAAMQLFTENNFDVVIMDVQLGDDSGLDCVQAIRKQEGEGKRIAVVGFSAHFMTKDLEAALDAGMDEYLVKPVSAARIVETVERLGNKDR